MELDYINNISEWVRTTKPGNVKFAFLDPNRLQSFNCLVSRFNFSRGKERGMYVHYHFCQSKGVAVSVCVTWEEYKTKKNTKYRNDWKKQIPDAYLR